MSATAFVWAAAAIVAIELFLQLAVRSLRRDFQWLVTAADEHPRFDSAKLARYLAGAFDADLGWTRRPNTDGKEVGVGGRTITFRIDGDGARAAPPELTGSPRIAVFGDSYAFGRQVEDHETWEAELGRRLDAPVQNFGVGNYGADQALLRYDGTALAATIETVILAFVPETICRVQSCWKHYLEFGNTFAFKPRFALDGDRLELVPNAMRGPADFDDLAAHLPEVQRRDAFYGAKFRRVQFRFPYLASALRAPRRNLGLLGSLLLRAAARRSGRTDAKREAAPFTRVMRANIADAHAHYRRPGPTRLLERILERFCEACAARGHRPLVLVMPQLIDLVELRGTLAGPVPFFSRIAAHLPVLDLTPRLIQEPDRAGLYVEDLYGGHLSVAGNRLVASAVAQALDTPATGAH